MAKKPLSRNENELENLEAQNSSQQRADGGANIQTRHTGVVTPAAEEKEQKDYFANTLSPDLESDDDNENSEAEGAGAGVEGKGATGAVHSCYSYFYSFKGTCS